MTKLTSALFLCVLLAALMFSTQAFNFTIDSFPSSAPDKAFYIFAKLCIEDPNVEKFSKFDQFGITLDIDEKHSFPPIRQLYASFFHETTGEQILDLYLPDVRNNTLPPLSPMKWHPESEDFEFPLECMQMVAYLEYGGSDHVGFRGTAHATYSMVIAEGAPAVEKQSSIALDIYPDVAVAVKFNATCLEERMDCIVSPYLVTMVDLHQDLTSITYSVKGASNLQIDSEKEDDTQLQCWINNWAVTAKLGGTEGRGTYTLEYDFKKGYDYVINCKESGLVNGYDLQETSIMLLEGQSADGKKFVQTHGFNLQYDQNNVVLKSSARALSTDNNHIMITRFPLSQEETVVTQNGTITQFKAQVDFTGVKPSHFKVYVAEQNLETNTTKTISTFDIKQNTKKKDDEPLFPWFNVVLPQGTLDAELVVIAYFKENVELKDINRVQTTLEMTYHTYAFGGEDWEKPDHPSIPITISVIADSMVNGSIDPDHSAIAVKQTTKKMTIDNELEVDHHDEFGFTVPIQKSVATAMKKAILTNITLALPARHHVWSQEQFECHLESVGGKANPIAIQGIAQFTRFGTPDSLIFGNVPTANMAISDYRLACNGTAGAIINMDTTAFNGTDALHANILVRDEKSENKNYSQFFNFRWERCTTYCKEYK
eukprot:UN01267